MFADNCKYLCNLFQIFNFKNDYFIKFRFDTQFIYSNINDQVPIGYSNK